MFKVRPLLIGGVAADGSSWGRDGEGWLELGGRYHTQTERQTWMGVCGIDHLGSAGEEEEEDH